MYLKVFGRYQYSSLVKQSFKEFLVFQSAGENHMTSVSKILCIYKFIICIISIESQGHWHEAVQGATCGSTRSGRLEDKVQIRHVLIVNHCTTALKRYRFFLGSLSSISFTSEFHSPQLLIHAVHLLVLNTRRVARFPKSLRPFWIRIPYHLSPFIFLRSSSHSIIYMTILQ